MNIKRFAVCVLGSFMGWFAVTLPAYASMEPDIYSIKVISTNEQNNLVAIQNAQITILQAGKTLTTIRSNRLGFAEFATAAPDTKLTLLIQKAGYGDLRVNCPCQGVHYVLKPTESAASGKIATAFSTTQLGEAAFREGNLDKAITLYWNALDLNPNYAPAYVNLGTAYHHMNKLEDAIWAHKKALNLSSPEDKKLRSMAYYQLGQIYEADQNYFLALKQYRAAQNELPSQLYAKSIERIMIYASVN